MKTIIPMLLNLIQLRKEELKAKDKVERQEYLISKEYTKQATNNNVAYDRSIRNQSLLIIDNDPYIVVFAHDGTLERFDKLDFTFSGIIKNAVFNDEGILQQFEQTNLD